MHEGNLFKILRYAFPEYSWQPQPSNSLTGYASKSQQHLHTLVSDIFAEKEVYMNHFLGPEFRFRNTRLGVLGF